MHGFANSGKVQNAELTTCSDDSSADWENFRLEND